MKYSLALTLMLPCFFGCSGEPKMSEVHGTVTVNDKLAEGGTITFLPVDGKSVTTGAEIGPDGQYLCKVPAGTMKVQIRVPKVTGRKKLYDTPESPFQDILVETLPDKYNNTTELTLDVTSGKVEKNWDLKSSK